MIKCSYPFKEVTINPPDSVIAKININYHETYIAGFKFFNKDNLCVLEAGRFNFNDCEILLEEGEKLLGVKSTHFNNEDCTHAVHCNMILIFGKMV